MPIFHSRVNILVLTRCTGDQVNIRFFRALSWRVHSDLRSSRYTTDRNILGTAFCAVEAAERIRSFEAKTSPYGFVSTSIMKV